MRYQLCLILDIRETKHTNRGSKTVTRREEFEVFDDAAAIKEAERLSASCISEYPLNHTPPGEAVCHIEEIRRISSVLYRMESVLRNEIKIPAKKDPKAA